MSFSRIALGALIAGVVAFNANAATANQTNSASDNAAKPMALEHAGKTKHAKRIAAAKLDINSADEAALAKVRGIGPKRAKAIIDYRTKNGPLASLDDLKNITNAKGKSMFSAKSIERLARAITIGSQQASSGSNQAS